MELKEETLSVGAGYGSPICFFMAIAFFWVAVLFGASQSLLGTLLPYRVALISSFLFVIWGCLIPW